MARGQGNQRFQRRLALEIGLQSRQNLDKRDGKRTLEQNNYSKQRYNQKISGRVFKWQLTEFYVRDAMDKGKDPLCPHRFQLV